MKKSLVLLFLLGFSFCNAQEINHYDTIRNALKTLNYNQFILKAKSMRKHKHYLTTERDLASNFRESIHYMYQGLSPLTYDFKINLITKDSTIVYYEIIEKKHKKVKRKKWEPYLDTLASYTNDSLYFQLKTIFITDFGGELNARELFINDNVYGNSCGFISDPTEGMILIDQLVAQRDTSQLMQLLHSTNFETQLYAINGLWQLKNKGMEYTEQELFYINNVLKKRGSIFYCSGCVYRWEDSQKVSHKFNFNN